MRVRESSGSAVGARGQGARERLQREVAEARQRLRALEEELVAAGGPEPVRQTMQARLDWLEAAHVTDTTRNELLQMCLDSLGEGIVVTDSRLRFLVYNPAAERIIGRGASTIPVEHWAGDYGIFHPDGRTPMATDELPLVRALHGDEFDHLEALIRNEARPEGVWINCVGRPLRDEADRIIGAIVSFQDITERRRVRQLLNKFYTAAEQSASILVMVNAEGVVEYVNPTCVRTFQRTPDEVLGRPIWNIVPEDQQEMERIWELLHHAGEYRGNTFCHRKDGSTVLLSGAVTAVRDDGGNVTHWLGLFVDSTDQQRVEREKQESEARFRRLVESNLIGVLLGRTDGRIEDANDEFLRIVGYAREDLLALHYRDFLPSEEQEGMESIELELGERGAIPPFECEYVRKDGHRIPVYVGIAHVPDTEQTVAFAMDLTEQKRAEAELKQSAADLARSNADLQHFAYIVSHDLQEPLRMVTGFLQILKKRHASALDGDAAKLVDYAMEGAQGMQNLIRDLLEYARVDTTSRALEPTDANIALQSALANLGPRIEEAEADVRATRLPRVRVDTVQLVQVFQNLLGNAVKFHRPGVRPKVRVNARRSNGEWVFSVKDNGIGIESHQQKKIFTIFQRLHPRSLYPGTGIGLAITKKIIERHGGRVWVESTSGRGSTFYFTLPAG